eukprot:1160573-Pelagomonas_calceolata.AAC.24
MPVQLGACKVAHASMSPTDSSTFPLSAPALVNELPRIRSPQVLHHALRLRGSGAVWHRRSLVARRYMQAGTL